MYKYAQLQHKLRGEGTEKLTRRDLADASNVVFKKTISSQYPGFVLDFISWQSFAFKRLGWDWQFLVRFDVLIERGLPNFTAVTSEMP